MVNETTIAAVNTYLYQQLIVGIIILLGMLALGVLVRKFLQRFLGELGLNRTLSKKGFDRDWESGISSVCFYAISVFGVVLFLDKLGLTSLVIFLIIILLLALLLLTTFVGLKDVPKNILGGILIRKEGKLRVGKLLTLESISGVIEKIGWLETQLETSRGDILYVPNALFRKGKYKVS